MAYVDHRGRLGLAKRPLGQARHTIIALTCVMFAEAPVDFGGLTRALAQSEPAQTSPHSAPPPNAAPAAPAQTAPQSAPPANAPATPPSPPAATESQAPAAAPPPAPPATTPATPAAPAAPPAAGHETPPAPPPKGATPATVIDDKEVDTILGKEIRSPTGENMGRIVDVLVDHNGNVRAAIIDFGGFLGVGSRKIAVDWRAIQFAPDGKPDHIVLALNRNEVRLAPEYKHGEPIVVLGPTPAQPVANAPANPAQPAGGQPAANPPPSTGQQPPPNPAQPAAGTPPPTNPPAASTGGQQAPANPPAAANPPAPAPAPAPQAAPSAPANQASPPETRPKE